MDTSTPLAPPPRIWLRVTILVLLAALASIGSSPWYAKLVFCVAMAALLGTFPRPRINAERFEIQWFAVFVPVHVRTVQLEDVIQIETDLESRLGLETGVILALVIGLWNVLMIWLVDWLVPWFGGDYKIWLRTGRDQRVLAWQGMGENNFPRNLDILEDISGLPVTRG
jgi:hypothetical protein